MPAASPVGVLRANVDFAKRILTDRVGNDYVYGGNWNPNNTSVGTDCSGLVVDICDAVRNGPRMAWSRHGMSTESWRPIEVGQTGTIFNTVCVAHPRDFHPTPSSRSLFITAPAVVRTRIPGARSTGCAGSPMAPTAALPEAKR